jgi:hypothetical protein
MRLIASIHYLDIIELIMEIPRECFMGMTIYIGFLLMLSVLDTLSALSVLSILSIIIMLSF